MKEKVFKICFKSVDKNINNYFFFVTNTLKNTGINFKRVSLPTKTKRFTLLKSPHVNKKAREQFQLKKLKKIILVPVNKKTENMIKFFMLNKPKFIKINMRRII